MADEYSEDSPSFIRQRRNVMVTSLVVLAIVVLHLQYRKIQLFEVYADAPQNFDIAWAILMLYFVWRLFQCEKPHALIKRLDDYYVFYLTRRMNKSKLVEIYRLQAAKDCNAKLSEGGPTSVVVPYGAGQAVTTEQLKVLDVSFEGAVLYRRDYEGLFFEFKYSLKLNTENSTSQAYMVGVNPYSFDSLISKVLANALATWKTHYFTEYVFPFWLGFGTIFYCSLHHYLSIR